MLTEKKKYGGHFPISFYICFNISLFTIYIPYENSQQTRNKKELLQTDKEHLWKPTANILNGERVNILPLRSGTREGCPFSESALFNTVLKGLASTMRCEKEMKCIHTGRE